MYDIDYQQKRESNCAHHRSIRT